MTGYLTCETVIAGTSVAAEIKPKEIDQCILTTEVLFGFEGSSTTDELWLLSIF